MILLFWFLLLLLLLCVPNLSFSFTRSPLFFSLERKGYSLCQRTNSNRQIWCIFLVLSFDFFSFTLSCFSFCFVWIVFYVVCVCFCLVCAKMYYCFNIGIHQFSLLFLLIQQPLPNFLFRSLKWSLLASNSVSGFVLNADLGLSYVQHILLFLWNFLTPKWCPWKSAPCLLPDVIRNFDYYYNCVMTIMETKITTKKSREFKMNKIHFFLRSLFVAIRQFRTYRLRICFVIVFVA